MKKMALMAFALLLAPHPAQAQPQPESLGTFGYWETYKMRESQGLVCYMSITAPPPSKEGNKTRRGQVVLMIAHRPAEKAVNVVSYTAGLRYKSASDLIVKADGQEFSLFTQGNAAWARDPATDQALTNALRRAARATFWGMSAQGERIADAVNLKGSAKAYEAISQACAVPFEKLTSSGK